jgi:transcriptional regulator with XRE-family HTH domain
MIHTFDISDFMPTLTEQRVKLDLMKRVKERRKELGITQKELSQRSGVSYGSIRRFELQGDISLHALLRVGSVLMCLDDFNTLFSHLVIKDIRR